MGLPVCGNNPTKLRCGRGVRLAAMGFINNFTSIQTKNCITALSFGHTSVVLRKRERSFGITLDDKFIYNSDSFACQSTYDSSSYFAYDPATVDQQSKHSLAENYRTTDAKIIYFDLRNDFIMMEEEVDQIIFDADNRPNVAWLDPSGLPVDLVSVSISSKTPISISEKDIIQDKYTADRKTPSGLDWGGDLYIALPWQGGQPKNDIKEDYLLYNDDTRIEFGGNDMYYPRWNQPLGIQHDDDNTEKQQHLVLLDEPNLGVPMTVEGDDQVWRRTDENTYYPFAPAISIKGSAAFDANGNCFYSYKDVNGVGKAKLIVDGEEVTIPIEEGQDYTAWYPISII